jgi:hypothetical protein
MVAAMLLWDTLDAGAAFAPFCGYYCAAAVRGRFVEARRFRENKGAQNGEHLRQAWGQKAQQGSGKVRWRHREDMLTAPMLLAQRIVSRRKVRI